MRGDVSEAVSDEAKQAPGNGPAVDVRLREAGHDLAAAGSMPTIDRGGNPTHSPAERALRSGQPHETAAVDRKEADKDGRGSELNRNDRLQPRSGIDLHQRQEPRPRLLPKVRSGRVRSLNKPVEETDPRGELNSQRKATAWRRSITSDNTHPVRSPVSVNISADHSSLNAALPVRPATPMSARRRVHRRRRQDEHRRDHQSERRQLHDTHPWSSTPALSIPEILGRHF